MKEEFRIVVSCSNERRVQDCCVSCSNERRVQDCCEL